MTTQETEEAVRAEFDRLAAEHNLAGWKFAFNDRFRTTMGQCHYLDKQIYVGSWAVKASVPIAQLIDVVRHEVAHAIAPAYSNHGPEWVKACAVTGARPETYYPAKFAPAREWKWRAYCPTCDKVVARWRQSPANIDRRRFHTDCGTQVHISRIEK